jgi:cell division protease FtsH
VLREHLEVLHKLAELLLEKETVLGKELDELITELRPGIELTSHKLDDNEPEAEAQAEPDPT